MAEVVASLVGAIVGSVVTLVYTNWHERSAQKKERQILRNALLEECQLQMALLESLGKQYAQSQHVCPVRVSLDVFAYALNRHLSELGDVKLIRALSQFILNLKALNATLDRYEPALLKAMEVSDLLQNVEQSRKGICRNVQLCMNALNDVRVQVESKGEVS